MNTKRISIFYLILTATAMLVFTACSKDDIDSDNDVVIWEYATSIDPSGKAMVIKTSNIDNGNNDISSAKVTLGYQSLDGEWHYLEYSAEYENGGFELHLPITIPDEFLSPSSNVLLYEDNIHLSDINAKNIYANIIAYNSDGDNIGSFSFSSDKWQMAILYADRNYTEKGITNSGFEYNCSYQRGWNVVYYYWDVTNSKITTQRPKNEKFKCYFSVNMAEYLYLN